MLFRSSNSTIIKSTQQLLKVWGRREPTQPLSSLLTASKTRD